MEPNLNCATSTILSGMPIGYATNGGAQRYLIEAESTTGFVAWKLADGTTLVNCAAEVSLPVSPSVSFWSCNSYTDITFAGYIISLDCHANDLTQLNVTNLTALRYLDCCFNQIAELNVSTLTEIEVLDVDNNQLTSLDVHDLKTLRILNCASNRLTKLDLSGLAALQVLDCSLNPLSLLNLDGCSARKDFKGIVSERV